MILRTYPYLHTTVSVTDSSTSQFSLHGIVVITTYLPLHVIYSYKTYASRYKYLKPFLVIILEPF